MAGLPMSGETTRDHPPFAAAATIPQQEFTGNFVGAAALRSRCEAYKWTLTTPDPMRVLTVIPRPTTIMTTELTSGRR